MSASTELAAGPQGGPPRSSGRVGRILDAVKKLLAPAPVVPTDEAFVRAASRPPAHPEDLTTQFEPLDAAGQLGIATLVRVATTDHPDPSEITSTISHQLDERPRNLEPIRIGSPALHHAELAVLPRVRSLQAACPDGASPR